MPLFSYGYIIISIGPALVIELHSIAYYASSTCFIAQISVCLKWKGTFCMVTSISNSGYGWFDCQYNISYICIVRTENFTNPSIIKQNDSVTFVGLPYHTSLLFYTISFVIYGCNAYKIYNKYIYHVRILIIIIYYCYIMIYGRLRPMNSKAG